MAQDVTRFTAEEMVSLAIERSVVDILKDEAVSSFHEEVGLILQRFFSFSPSLVLVILRGLIKNTEYYQHY